jgi:hypothetical protein
MRVALLQFLMWINVKNKHMCGLCGVSMQVSAIWSHIQGKKHLGRFERSDVQATSTLPHHSKNKNNKVSCWILIPTKIKILPLNMPVEFPTIDNCKISKATHEQRVARAVYGTMGQMGALLGVGDDSLQQCHFSCSFHKS